MAWASDVCSNGLFFDGHARLAVSYEPREVADHAWSVVPSVILETTFLVFDLLPSRPALITGQWSLTSSWLPVIHPVVQLTSSNCKPWAGAMSSKRTASDEILG